MSSSSSSIENNSDTTTTTATVDDILKTLKILYVHGLEGSNRDRRAQMLTRVFPGTKCPDMRTVETLKRGKALVNLGSLGGAGVIAYVAYLLGIKKNRLYSMIAFVLASGTALAFLVRWAMRKVLRQTFEQSLDTQRRYIKNYKPDLIVAGGYGGAVVAEIIRAQKYFYKNPLLMLAPAQEEWARRLGQSTKDIIVPRTIPKTVIVHGLKDNMVPCQDSVDYATRSRVDNQNVQVYLEDEDHRMMKTLTEVNLKKWVIQAMSLDVNQEQEE